MGNAASDGTFKAFGFRSELLAAFAGEGWAVPFPVQARAMPPVLEGRDALVLASTGSGKTAAFVAPILDRLSGSGTARPNSTRALVLVPTRELAVQVSEVALRLSRFLPVRFHVRTAFGGVSINPQMLALRGGADLLVATPGRLIDLAGRRAVRLDGLRFLVLDEADRMLDLGFRDEMTRILALVPRERQTLLFSATWNESVEAVAGACLRDPVRVEAYEAVAPVRQDPGVGATGAEERAPGVGAADAAGNASGDRATGHDGAISGSQPGVRAGIGAETAESLEAEIVYLVGRDEKGPFLRRLLCENGWKKVLVFACSARRADNVARKLGNAGIVAAVLHGEKSQGARAKAMADFRGGSVRVLVATDLASRGLDVDGLECVVNYELPRSPADYVHRTGRTGRAGRSGTAVTLASPEEEHALHVLEKFLRRGLERRKP